jgi:hypothetical protein
VFDTLAGRPVGSGRVLLRADRRALLKALAAGVLPMRAGFGATPYAGPLIDAHSHLNAPETIEPLVAALDRHKIAKVALLGVGGVQQDDAAWIARAAERYPDRVIAVAPVSDLLAADAARRLERDLASGRFRGAGEVHVHQASRKRSDEASTRPSDRSSTSAPLTARRS